MERKNTSDQIPGTRQVSQNSQLLVSSGIPAFDRVLGGGLPVGTVTLIEEDMYGTYAKTMVKYFVAEGIVSKHSIFFASQDSSPQEVIRETPAVIHIDIEPTSFAPEVKSKTNSDDNMKIAFRYKNLPMLDEEQTNFRLGHHYDLARHMPIEDIENSDIFYWTGSRVENGASNFMNPAYNDLLRQIKSKIKEDKFFLKDNPTKKSILRIAVHSLGSPLWLPTRYTLHSADYSKDLVMFIFCLRALVRSALAVAVITIPSHLYHEDALSRCNHSSDISIRLQSFAGTELETNKALSDYHGFFHLTKLAPMNSLASKHPGSIDYAFKLSRRKFSIEKLHLPPDFEGSDDGNKKGVASGCHGTKCESLDF